MACLEESRDCRKVQMAKPIPLGGGPSGGPYNASPALPDDVRRGVDLMHNPAAGLGTGVVLSLQADGLVNEAGTPPNSMAVVFVKTDESEAFEVLGRTNYDRNEGPNSNPKYDRKFPIEYNFTQHQVIRICVYDRVTGSTNLNEQYLIGVCDTSLGAVINAGLNGEHLDLYKNGQSVYATVCVTATEVKELKQDVVFHIGLRNLMTDAETREQEEYLTRLRGALNFESSVAPAKHKLTTSIMHGLRGNKPKTDDKNAARPAHIVDQMAREDQARKQIAETISQTETMAHEPPFMPFVVIYRAASTDVQAEYSDLYDPRIEWEQVYATPNIMEYSNQDNRQNEHCRLAPIRLPVMSLNGGHRSRLIKFSVMRAKRGSETVLLGSTVSYLDLLQSNVFEGNDFTLDLKMEMGRVAGPQLVMYRLDTIDRPTFRDTLQENKLDMALIVAIDFTESNGPMHDPESLHYCNPQKKERNPYEAAISGVANLLLPHASSEEIVGYGFGARTHFSPNEAAQCFSITGDEQNPLSANLNEFLLHYRTRLQHIMLWGPTMFSEVLKGAQTVIEMRLHRSAPGAPIPYSCILLITDGVVDDMERTKSVIVGMSRLPISVIIIGVGKENFGRMRELDDTPPNGMIKSASGTAVRRLTKFILYNDFVSDGSGAINASALAAASVGTVRDHGTLSFIERTLLPLLGGRHERLTLFLGFSTLTLLLVFECLCSLLGGCAVVNLRAQWPSTSSTGTRTLVSSCGDMSVSRKHTRFVNLNKSCRHKVRGRLTWANDRKSNNYIRWFTVIYCVV